MNRAEDGEGIGRRMACYGVFTGGARSGICIQSICHQPLSSGYSRLGISPDADLRDNGDHSYGKSDGGGIARDSARRVTFKKLLRLVRANSNRRCNRPDLEIAREFVARDRFSSVFLITIIK